MVKRRNILARVYCLWIFVWHNSHMDARGYEFNHRRKYLPTEL